jgi:methionine synthase II (cobalamin-independent)
MVGRIFERLPLLPASPQLPVRDWRESMYVQYSEGLPGVAVDLARQRIEIRAAEARAGLERFYEAVVGEDIERFAISREFALGLHLFLERVRAVGAPGPAWVKGQSTGPFSFAMTVTDENKRSLAYTPELLEIAVQGMTMKARWLARRLRECRPTAEVLVVLDEPYLCSFGSAFVNVPRDEVVAAIAGAVAAIQAEGARAGLHCCGNTDWSLVLATGVDLVNFDAHEYWQGLSLYPAELGAFLERGGVLAWGIVPTVGESVDRLEAGALLALLEERIAALVAKGLPRERLLAQSLLTPSCGLGTQTPERAARALELLVELAALARRRLVLGVA